MAKLESRELSSASSGLTMHKTAPFPFLTAIYRPYPTGVRITSSRRGARRGKDDSVARRGFPDGAHFQSPLRSLDEPGKVIKRLKGRFSVEVSAREPGSPAKVVEATFDFADIPMP